MTELDDRVKQVQAAYDKAVKDGSIDPKKMDIERFADVIAEDIEYFDTPAKDLSDEEKASERAVAQLQSRNSELRKNIFQKWFGKND